jgi:hypothetical protein
MTTVGLPDASTYTTIELVSCATQLCVLLSLILTGVVVASTRWGRELSYRPGVYVAGSTAEVLGVVDQVV